MLEKYSLISKVTLTNIVEHYQFNYNFSLKKIDVVEKSCK